MENEQGTEKTGAKSGLTREQQIAKLMPAMRKFVPSIITVANSYHKAYPVDTTDPAVLDAVTVSLPYTHFMVMAGICTSLAMIEIDKEKKQAMKTEVNS